MFKGILIKECLEDESVLNNLKIESIELWEVDKEEKFWTAITFSSDDPQFPYKLSKSIKNNKIWYCDFKEDKIKYIVLKDCVYYYEIGKEEEKQAIQDECLKLGLSKEDIDWTE